MKKYVLLLICLSFLFTACNNEEIPTEETASSPNTENEAGEKMQLVDLSKRERETIDLLRMKQVNQTFEISERVIKIEGDASVDDYVLAEGKLYYAVSYASYYDELYRKDESAHAFKNKHNTQIRVYDVATGEDTILYQYEEEYAVGINDMRCQDGCLIWTGTVEGEEEMLCEQTVNLTDGERSYELFSEQLYGYDPFVSENPVTIGDVVTEYQHGNRWSKITVKSEGKKTEIGTRGLAVTAISNGDICVWNIPTQQNNIHIYDMINDKYYSMGFESTYTGRFGIYGQWFVIDLPDGLYAYDIPEGYYAKLTNSDLGRVFVADKGVYGVAYDSENNELKVTYIK